LTFQNHTNRPLTDFGGKTSIFSHPVYLFLREFSLQDFRGGSVQEIVRIPRTVKHRGVDNGFLSPVKRRLLENVVYVITETERKTAMQIRRRRVYQRLLKVDPLKCILCGGQMRFTGLKRGYRLAELVMMHEPLARQRVYS
ncbi:hypothetical protein LAX06_22720, partial [Escherichia coli]|nr:hypothetical protein [Escherichia coli]